MTNTAKTVLSIDETAEFLGMSRSTVYGLIRQKRLVSTRIGTRRVVRRENLEAFLKSCDDPDPSLELMPRDLKALGLDQEASL